MWYAVLKFLLLFIDFIDVIQFSSLFALSSIIK